MTEEPLAENQRFFQRLRQHAAVAWRSVVDVVTPPLCLACQEPVTAGACLCLGCWLNLRFIDEPVCEVLGTPFAYDEGEGAVSPAAIADPPSWDKARAAVVFNAASKHLVHLLKYRDVQEAGLVMARLMASAGRNLWPQADVIIPVPLHQRRLWTRRFNQAACLAAQLARQVHKPWQAQALLRTTATQSQVGKTAEQRRRNVQRAFKVPLEKRSIIDGKTVLLVDDVRTTGATASACAQALKNAGAAQVHVLTFALVLEPARLHNDA